MSDLCCFIGRAKNTINYSVFFDWAWSAAGVGSRIAKATALTGRGRCRSTGPAGPYKAPPTAAGPWARKLGRAVGVEIWEKLSSCWLWGFGAGELSAPEEPFDSVNVHLCFASVLDVEVRSCEARYELSDWRQKFHCVDGRKTFCRASAGNQGLLRSHAVIVHRMQSRCAWIVGWRLSLPNVAFWTDKKLAPNRLPTPAQKHPKRCPRLAPCYWRTDLVAGSVLASCFLPPF